MLNALFLAMAILSEVAGTTALKFTVGFTRIGSSLAVVALYGLSFYFMAQALKEIPMGVVYAVWSGIGTALIASIGFFWFNEPMTALKLASIALIIFGVIGLNLSGTGG